MNGFDVCVRGRGAVGQALALSLARLGLRVALAAAGAPPAGPDVRTSLGAPSIALLDQLKVWDALRAARPSAATRVTAMQVAGDHGGALEFSAWQQHVQELAWIVDAAALERELAAGLRVSPHVTLVGRGGGHAPAFAGSEAGNAGLRRGERPAGMLSKNLTPNCCTRRLPCFP